MSADAGASRVDGRTLAIRCALVRGGTSRALVFRQEDLPADRALWDVVFLSAIGSPDRRQLDGVGAGDSHTSKIAVLAGSDDPAADVDYLFGEVAILEPHVDYAGNSGNIIAGLGLYAVEEGMVAAVHPQTLVRVRNVNTDKVAEVVVPTPGGVPAEDGDFAIDGVPGTGPRIDLVFRRAEGALTGRLLPASAPVCVLRPRGEEGVEATLVDAANPALVLRGEALGVDPARTVESLNADTALLERIEALRAEAAVRMGLVERAADAAGFSRMVPFPVLVFPPASYTGYTGERIESGSMDLAARVISLGMVHKSINVTVSVALTAAALLPGTVARAVRRTGGDAAELRIGHPSGVVRTRGRIGEDPAGAPILDEVSLGRTARRIMQGEVLVQPHKRRWLESILGRPSSLSPDRARGGAPGI
jgi:2-methylaconitate cis-trans-isomerase PrpF